MSQDAGEPSKQEQEQEQEQGFLERAQTHRVVGSLVRRAMLLCEQHVPAGVRSGVQRAGAGLVRVADPVGQRLGLPPLGRCAEQLHTLGCHTLALVDQTAEALHAAEAHACAFLLTRTEALVDRLLPAGAEQSGAEQSGAEQSGAEQSGAEQSGAEQSGAEQSGAEQSGAEQSGADTDADSTHPLAAPTFADLACTVRDRLMARVQELKQLAAVPPLLRAPVHTAQYVAGQACQTLAPVAQLVAQAVQQPASVVDAVQLRRKELREKLAAAVKRARSAPLAFFASYVPVSLVDASEKSYVYVRAVYVDPAVKSSEELYGKLHTSGSQAASFVVDYVRPYETRFPVQQAKQYADKARTKVVAILENNASTIHAFAHRFGLHMWIPAEVSAAAVAANAAAN